MMKFFKYLIFLLLLISTFAKAENWYLGGYSDIYYPSAQSACEKLLQNGNGTAGTLSVSNITSTQATCTFMRYGSTSSGSVYLKGGSTSCTAGSSSVYSGSVTVQNWKDYDEWLNLNDALMAKYTGTTVCSNSCVHKFDFLGAGEGDATNGPVTFKGKYVSTAQTCTSPTQGPTDTLNGTKTPTSDGCKNGEAYCDKPTTGCPSGYTSGSFNGKQICVKNNPDPTKPNPNDPNNNPNNSTFDDSKIIASINDSKTAITNSINNAVNSINSSISSINQSITTVVNAVNGTTNAVNNNTAATNAVKSSVDALHNTINAVTTAVNNNKSAVTSAVNANTTATNAVKASVDALNSTVSAVTIAVDNNTKAVNANGDKVSNAVNQNTTATNAVKDAVNNLNNAVQAVTDAVNTNGNKTKDAIDSNTNAVNANGDKVTNAVNANGDKVTNAVNANGDKITNAVNKGTEATKANGEKLDGIKDGVEEGNGLLKDINDTLNDIKQWLTEEQELPENQKPEIEEFKIEGYEKSYVSWDSSCPPDVRVPISLMGQSSTLVLKWSPWCELLSKLRWAIIACAYFSAAYIILGMR